jgi:GT2 family glycosyltransferase
MPDKRPIITTIIVNYDTPQETIECLQSLAKIKHLNFDHRIVVVDNGSQEFLKLPGSLNQKNIELIRTEANIGFTGGNNLGISHAVKQHNSDYLLLLNSDTTVDPNFLEELYLGIQGENRGIATSKIYFEAGYEFHHESYQKRDLGKVFWFAGGVIDWANLMAFHRGVDEVDRGHFDNQLTTDFATGCTMLIKREVIEEVGILDKKYFLYLEDVDYSMRVLNKGYKIVFCPKAIVYHKNAGSSGGAGSQLHQYYQTRNRLLFFFKYAPWRYRLTAAKFLIKLILTGSAVEKKAARDYLLGRFGKQPII